MYNAVRSQVTPWERRGSAVASHRTQHNSDGRLCFEHAQIKRRPSAFCYERRESAVRSPYQRRKVSDNKTGTQRGRSATCNAVVVCGACMAPHAVLCDTAIALKDVGYYLFQKLGQIFGTLLGFTLQSHVKIVPNDP